MSRFKWYRDQTSKTIIVLIDDIEIYKFSSDAFVEANEILKQHSSLWNQLFDMFPDHWRDYSLENAEII